MSGLSRRHFLGILTLTGASGFLAACDPVALLPPDRNGVKVHVGFRSRIIATTGRAVAGTGYRWHANPDGGACFALPDGGWSYVSNSEAVAGGAGFVRFDVDGTIVGAGRCLDGTIGNCAGGATPWGTWLSCEEVDLGHVWECDPIGASPARIRPALGAFMHEAAAADERNRCIYLTEDRADGALYRFVPTTWGELAAGTLQVLTEAGGQLSWADVPDPDGTPVATRNQVPGTKRFNGGEGAAMSLGRLVFTTKGDNRVWVYDPAANRLTIAYDRRAQANGVLSGVDNVTTSQPGVVYVAEDGGNMQIVLVREDGRTFPVVELPGVQGSEITGPAFDPSGTRLYFSSQRNPGTTYEVSGPWDAFTFPS